MFKMTSNIILSNTHNTHVFSCLNKRIKCRFGLDRCRDFDEVTWTKGRGWEIQTTVTTAAAAASTTRASHPFLHLEETRRVSCVILLLEDHLALAASVGSGGGVETSPFGVEGQQTPSHLTSQLNGGNFLSVLPMDVENKQYMTGLAAELSGANDCMKEATAMLVWVWGTCP